MKNKYIKKITITVLIFALTLSAVNKLLFHYFGQNSDLELFLNGILRLLLITTTIYLIFVEKIINHKYLFRNNIIVLPIVAVLIYFSLSNTFSKLNAGIYEFSDFRHYSYLFKNLSIGFFEEFFFRVLIFSYLFKVFKPSEKTNHYKEFVFASIIFGVVHFLNLTNGFSFIYVFNQVIGAMIIGIIFQFILFRLNNIILISMLHGLVNYHGMFDISLLRIVRDNNISLSISDYYGIFISLAFFIFILIPITYYSLKNQEIKLIRSDS